MKKEQAIKTELERLEKESEEYSKRSGLSKNGFPLAQSWKLYFKINALRWVLEE